MLLMREAFCQAQYLLQIASLDAAWIYNDIFSANFPHLYWWPVSYLQFWGSPRPIGVRYPSIHKKTTQLMQKCMAVLYTLLIASNSQSHLPVTWLDLGEKIVQHYMQQSRGMWQSTVKKNMKPEGKAKQNKRFCILVNPNCVKRSMSFSSLTCLASKMRIISHNWEGCYQKLK